MTVSIGSETSNQSSKSNDNIAFETDLRSKQAGLGIGPNTGQSLRKKRGIITPNMLNAAGPELAHIEQVIAKEML